MQYMYVASLRCLPQIASTKYRQCVLYSSLLYLRCYFAFLLISILADKILSHFITVSFQKKLEGTKRLSYDGFAYTLTQSLAISQVLTKAFAQV